MGALFDKIRQCVLDGRYLTGQHAVERLEERGILDWQIVDGAEHAELVIERPHDLPNPSVEVRQLLADGTEVTVIWSYVLSADTAKLVTVYFYEE